MANDFSPGPVGSSDFSDPVRIGMHWIEGATFRMGSDRNYPEEAPSHFVQVDGFWIDEGPVTNREFEEFVRDTGHVTLAEESPDAALYPGALPEMLRPASLVFFPPEANAPSRGIYDWWQYTFGADWRHPYGPDSDLSGLEDHPVVHVAYNDALAFAQWAGKSLPTEAEWERAARGELEGAEFAWGDQLYPNGEYRANTWQGEFPRLNEVNDGYIRTSPVGAFPANGFGLYDMIGNVWEWTQDWWATRKNNYPSKPCCAPANPRGGIEDESVDPSEPAKIPRKVLKGGSHLCAPSYCQRYRPAARHPQPIDSSTSHIGFRCIIRP